MRSLDAVPKRSREGVDPNGRVKSEFGIVSGRGKARERSNRVDLGLALLQCLARPDVPLSSDDIAAWCDCSTSAIWIIEQKALQKLRKRVAYSRDPVLRELVDSFLR